MRRCEGAKIVSGKGIGELRRKEKQKTEGARERRERARKKTEGGVKCEGAKIRGEGELRDGAEALWLQINFPPLGGVACWWNVRSLYFA